MERSMAEVLSEMAAKINGHDLEQKNKVRYIRA